MKRILLTINILFMALLTTHAQPKLSGMPEKFDFGSIQWKEPATARFTISNSGNKPLVIHKVETSCGCVVASWPKTPIRPHQQVVLEAVYDARMLGHFNKAVRIYTNADPRPVQLSMQGVVSTEVVDYSRNYPFQIGELHVNTDHIEFADANKGDHPVFELKIANGSSKDYTPVLMHLPSYIEAKAVPERLAPRETGVIRLTFLSEESPFLGISRSDVYLSRYPGDKVGDDNQIDVLSVLLPDFSKLTQAQMASAPAIQLSTHEVDLGTMGEEKTLKTVILITNTGRSTLKLQDVQVTNPALNISLKKETVAPGKTIKMHVSVQAKYLRKNLEHTPRILMITNDPKQPKTVINVKVKR